MAGLSICSSITAAIRNLVVLVASSSPVCTTSPAASALDSPADDSRDHAYGARGCCGN